MKAHLLRNLPYDNGFTNQFDANIVQVENGYVLHITDIKAKEKNKEIQKQLREKRIKQLEKNEDMLHDMINMDEVPGFVDCKKTFVCKTNAELLYYLGEFLPEEKKSEA